MIDRIPTKSGGAGDSNRKWYVKCSLLEQDGSKVGVCKAFFLATLGYPKTSSVIQELLKTPDTAFTPDSDKRGKAASHNALTDDLGAKLCGHIMSYNPCISHYRREHGPNRLYLSSEITEKLMHQDFNSKNINSTVSYETYSRHVRKLNISFAKLGEEQCELCIELSHASHEKTNGECIAECTVCVRLAKQTKLYISARNIYKEDGREVVDGTIVRSIDPQKVIILPRLPGIKTVCFTKPIIVFHETFAPIKAYLAISDNLCVLWHEGLAGRKCKEITSVFLKALVCDRDYKTTIYFMDNWSAQNKNWSIITAMVQAINSGNLQADSITF